MISDFHLLRPWWLLALLLLLGLLALLWRQKPMQSWRDVCDGHLLEQLMQQGGGRGNRQSALLLLFFSAFFMVISLSGPTWSKLSVPSFRTIAPRVLILDMSGNMQAQDLTPDRLTRAKFKLHDLLKRRDAGQFGLVVFTGEPFVVSPLTEDSHTIDTLVDSLTPAIMPVDGQNLNRALLLAAELITQAGFHHGQLLVLTASPPDAGSINTAETLSKQGIVTSILPIVADKTLGPLFKPLAVAGHGELLDFSDGSAELSQWLKATDTKQQFTRNNLNDVPLWQDEGRWFLLPAMVLLLPVFRRAWLQRIDV